MERSCEKCGWCFDAQTQDGTTVKACVRTGQAQQVDPQYFCADFRFEQAPKCSVCGSVLPLNQLSIINPFGDDQYQLLCPSCYQRLPADSNQ